MSVCGCKNMLNVRVSASCIFSMFWPNEVRDSVRLLVRGFLIARMNVGKLHYFFFSAFSYAWQPAVDEHKMCMLLYKSAPQFVPSAALR